MREPLTDAEIAALVRDLSLPKLAHYAVSRAAAALETLADENAALRAEVSHVDSVLARRPALDDLDERTAKIERAIKVAGECDRALDAARRLAGLIKRYVDGWNALEVPSEDMDALLVEMNEAATAWLAPPAPQESADAR